MENLECSRPCIWPRWSCQSVRYKMALEHKYDLGGQGKFRTDYNCNEKPLRDAKYGIIHISKL